MSKPFRAFMLVSFILLYIRNTAYEIKGKFGLSPPATLFIAIFPKQNSENEGGQNCGKGLEWRRKKVNFFWWSVEISHVNVRGNFTWNVEISHVNWRYWRLDLNLLTKTYLLNKETIYHCSNFTWNQVQSIGKLRIQFFYQPYFSKDANELE